MNNTIKNATSNVNKSLNLGANNKFTNNKLSNNTGNNGGLGLGLENLGIDFGNITNDLGNTYQKVQKQYNTFSNVEKLLIITLIVSALIGIIYLIYRRLRGPRLTETIFIPNLRNDASRPYIFTDSSGKRFDFIPYKEIPQPSPGQYTYSMWLYINGQPNNVDGKYWGSYRYNEWKHVMHRGSKLIDGQVKLQSPGFWLAPRNNKLYASISTRGDIEYITLADIDLDRWVNIVFVLNQNIIEIYKNGKLEKTLTLLHSTINQGQTNLWVTQEGGFPGNLAYIQYFNSSLPPGQVGELYQTNKQVFDRDMAKRNKSYIANYTPAGPIEPTPEPVPEPEPTPSPTEGVCT